MPPPFPLLLAAGAVLCAAAPNPFAPLTASEIRAAARIVKDSGRLPASARFSMLTLAEPPKDQVLRGAPVPRRGKSVRLSFARPAAAIDIQPIGGI